MHVQAGVLGTSDWPLYLRYEWAEDVDEVLADGTVCFTQCKRVDRILEPAALVDVFLGFAPKWLGVAETERRSVRFRLVCTDIRARDGLKAANAAQVKTHFLRDLEPRPTRGDQATWRDLAFDVGREALFDALWNATELVHVPATVHPSHPAGPLFEAEREALRVLLENEKLEPSGQADALRRIRGLLHDNLIAFDPHTKADLPERSAAPRELAGNDVKTALFHLTPRGGRRLPFEVVDAAHLRRVVRAAPVEPYIARLPRWADVARGEDRAARFVERDQTRALLELVERKLVAPIEQSMEHRLQALFVVGGPGCGKTTLVRRVASMLVEAGRVVVADPGVDPGEPADDPGSFASHVLDLADQNLPVLLLLDDPLYEDSEWPQVLRKLTRPGVRVAVLAASPRFVFDRFADEGLKGVEVTVFDVLPPTPDEQRRMAEFHDRALLPGAPDDFLALSFEAATGESFPTVIKNLWATLNAGRPPRATRFDKLPWTVRALFFVSFMQRTGIRCPEPLLATALRVSGGPEEGFELSDALTMLNEAHGWRIFRRHNRSRSSTFHGPELATAHVRIAEEAWHLRPPPRTHVAPLLMQAAVQAPETGRSLALALVRLEKMALEHVPDSGERTSIAALADAWAEAGTRGAISTRHLSDVSTVLRLNGFEADARTLIRAFAHALASAAEDSWIAAFELRMLDAETGDLAETIANANFAIAPIRARRFARLIETDQHALDALRQRLLDALEGKTAWTLPSSLLVWLMAHTKEPKTVLEHLPAFERWLREHPHDAPARVLHLSVLAQLTGPAYEHLSAHRERAIATTQAWLATHREDVGVRAQLLHALMKWRSPELERAIEEALAMCESGADEFLALNILKAVRRVGSRPLALRALRWAAAYLERVDYAPAAEMVVTAMVRPHKMLLAQRETDDVEMLATMKIITERMDIWRTRNPEASLSGKRTAPPSSRPDGTDVQ